MGAWSQLSPSLATAWTLSSPLVPTPRTNPEARPGSDKAIGLTFSAAISPVTRPSSSGEPSATGSTLGRIGSELHKVRATAIGGSMALGNSALAPATSLACVGTSRATVLKAWSPLSPSLASALALLSLLVPSTPAKPQTTTSSNGAISLAFTAEASPVTRPSPVGRPLATRSTLGCLGSQLHEVQATAIAGSVPLNDSS
mmetsp:Transcript_13545/g.30100  ORF Transcript_13545/g.30100 Transcript_13545/m.30100 type:complete len:200 (-) Transcript_13545:570-1169(-)